jgi:proteasome lid subunit RPN8/RPN11
LSDEDIQFDDVAYREPLKARRPDLDARLACIAYRLPGHADLPIFLEKKPADAIERHALRDTSVELGGILLGKECVDETTGEPFVWITEALEAKHYENTQASFTYTHDSWGEITRERDEKHPDLDIVGWYHTHPDFGIFLSSHDLFIHHNFFDQPLQVAYVVDPIRQDRGFFFWKDGRMIQTGGFWLAADRTERMALSRLVNDLEGIPTTDVGSGGGSGLTPRLEAELIAMLSRPHTVAMAPADRGQTAAVFTLFGTMLGAIFVLAALWLQSLAHTVQDQAKQIEAMAKAQEKTISAARDELGATKISAKEDALDKILGELKVDASAPKVVAKLSQVISQREEAIKELGRVKVEKDALADHASLLDSRIKAAENENLAIQRKMDAAEKENAREYNEVKKERDKLNEDLAEQKNISGGDANGKLQTRYNWVWYLAIAGWGGFLICGVWLLAILTREPIDPDQRDDDRPMHTTVTIK